MTFEEYCKYYNKYKRLVGNQYSNPNKKLSESQLVSKYNKYLKSIDKQKESRQRQIDRARERQKEKMKEGIKSTNKPVRKPIKPSDKAKKKNEEDRLKNAEVKSICMKRANNMCEIYPLLTTEEKSYIDSIMFPDVMVLDPLHIVSRSNKKLRHNPDNIVIGMRVLHSLIDQYVGFDGKPITAKQRDELWIRIIGEDRWLRLQDNK